MNAVTEAHLYKRLNISFHKVSGSAQEQNRTPFHGLLDALTKRPYRYAFIESLNMGLFRNASWDERIQSFFTLLRETSNVKTIALNCSQDTLSDEPLFELLDAKKIHTLKIGTAVVEKLTKPGILPELRSLSIWDAIEKDTEDTDDSWWKDYELPHDRRGVSPLQNLAVTSYESHPCAILPLVSWAKALKWLNLDFMAHSNYFLEDFSITQLQRILDVHHSTLQQVLLTTYSGHSIPDFRHFLNLRYLRLSNYEVFDNDPEAAAYKLVAPRLASITVDFDLEDQQSFVCREFEEMHSTWLKTFAKTYRSIIAVGGIRYIEAINVDEITADGVPILKRTKTALASMQISFEWPDAFEDYDDGEEEDEENDEDEDNDGEGEEPYRQESETSQLPIRLHHT